MYGQLSKTPPQKKKKKKEVENRVATYKTILSKIFSVQSHKFSMK